MFCGYLFHRSPCTRKIQVEGQFFRQRICSKCYYYRNTAADKLKAGKRQATALHGAGEMQGSLCVQVRSLNALVSRVGQMWSFLCVRTLQNCCCTGRIRVSADMLPCTCMIDHAHVVYAEVKQTTDLAMIEVRKGFSHVHQDTTGSA